MRTFYAACIHGPLDNIRHMCLSGKRAVYVYVYRLAERIRPDRVQGRRTSNITGQFLPVR
jgi:hypothetical protein